MWRAWATARPLAVTVQRAGHVTRNVLVRGLAETTGPRQQLAAAAAANAK